MKYFQISNNAKKFLKNKKVRLCAGIGAVIVVFGVSGAILNDTYTEQKNGQPVLETSQGLDVFTDFTLSNEPLVFTKGTEFMSRGASKKFEEQEKKYILNFLGEYDGGYHFQNLDGKDCYLTSDGENILFLYGEGKGAYVLYRCANDITEIKSAFVPLSEYIALNGYESVITNDMELSEIENMLNSSRMEIDTKSGGHSKKV